MRTGLGAAWPRPHIDASAIATESSSSNGLFQLVAPHERHGLSGADAARRALAARFFGEKLHQVARGRAAVSLVRQYDDRGRSDETAVRLQRIEIERNVAQLAGSMPPDAPPGRYA